jgi:outer membrane lipoprotein SlyB
MLNSLHKDSLLGRAAAAVSVRPAFLAALGSAIASLLLSGCAEPVTRTTHVYEAPGYPSRSPVMSTRFGTVERIDVIETEHGDSGGGAMLGALVGGVVGNQVGHGVGRAAATALGAFGGAVVGDHVERNDAAARSGTVYRVFVQFDDGGHRSFDYRSLNGLHTGERVRLQYGMLDRA